MTVLHVYNKSNSMASAYVDMLVKAVGIQAVMLQTTTDTNIKQLLAERKPDIVHLHGVVKVVLPSSCRVVVTAHGEPMIAGQRAYVFIARSALERQSLMAIGRHVETVRNPIITRSTTPQECAQQMLDIYRRVIDSNVYELMNANTRNALDMLLLASITGDRRWLPDVKAVDGLTPIGLQQIAIYAHMEGIEDYVCRGFEVLGSHPILPKHVDNYIPEDYHIPQPIDHEKPTALLADVRKNGPSMLRLVELANMLRADNLDEAVLLGEADKQQLMPTLQSMLCLLEEHQLTTEGFMPCPAADNSVTKGMRQQLLQRHSL